MRSRPKIGLAFGGGGSKGFAFIGVLRVFEKHKIPIDFIAGTSVGAFIGGLYASGHSTKDIEKIFKETNWTELLSASDFRTGLIGDDKINPYMVKVFKGKKFKDLEIPFACTAVDIQKGEEVVFHSGIVSSAVQASMSIPGLFSPTQIGNKFYVDGGILDPIPVGILKKKGIDVTIAVDVSQDLKHSILAHATTRRNHNKEVETIINKSLNNFREYLKKQKIIPKFLLLWFKPKKVHKKLHKKGPPIFEISAKSFYLLTNELSRSKLKEYNPSIIIRPKLDNVGMFDFHKINMMIKSGENAARRQLKQIRKLAKVQ